MIKKIPVNTQKITIFMLLTFLMSSTIFGQTKLVEVKTVIPNVVLDIRYATKNNFTGSVVYPSAHCFLAEPALRALKAASDEFNKLGYRIKIWDGYRPHRAQFVLWKLVPDPRYVADPKKGSKHNRGCAVDITLVDKDGNELDMGTEFDNFTERAHRDYTNLPEHVLKNRKLMHDVMGKHGFAGWKNEWWHFDFKDWQDYEILNIAFDEISNE